MGFRGCLQLPGSLKQETGLRELEQKKRSLSFSASSTTLTCAEKALPERGILVGPVRRPFGDLELRLEAWPRVAAGAIGLARGINGLFRPPVATWGGGR